MSVLICDFISDLLRSALFLTVASPLLPLYQLAWDCLEVGSSLVLVD
jgi:hypothetical protein